MPKQFPKEVKVRAVRMVREHVDEYDSATAAVTAVAKQVGCSPESLRRWCEQTDIDSGAKPGMTSEEREEIRKLKAENKRLQETNEILRAATVFFAGELDPRNR